LLTIPFDVLIVGFELRQPAAAIFVGVLAATTLALAFRGHSPICCRMPAGSAWGQKMHPAERRIGDRRRDKDRRSGVDTRSDEEKRLIGERRSELDRRSDVDRRSSGAKEDND
jgi:hypothetical protein